MAVSFFSRFKKAWNAFSNRDPTPPGSKSYVGSYYRPDRPRLSGGKEKSIVTALYNRIAIDASAIEIRHVRLDDNERYIDDIDSDLNNCLTLEANMDQTARAFMQDAIMSMLDEGCVALVPTDADMDPNDSDSYKIYTMRTGKINQWYPEQVKVELYNERKGKKEEICISKRAVAIIENPFYSVMNETNSTLQRLIRKLNLLDAIDEQSGSGKLDLIIQLPYVIKSQARKEQAQERRKEIEDQLSGSKYGIAYTDGTERITQLNRPTENNLMHQIEFLTSMLYSQLGITQEIMNGTANEETMLNYYNRTIEPLLTAVTLEMKRKFLTKTARTQKQSIVFIRDPFKLVPVNSLADIADKFTRNEILSSNEVRGIIGFRPSKDPKADELRNKNLNEKANPNEMSPEQLAMPNADDDQKLQNELSSLEQEHEQSVNELDMIDSELTNLENFASGEFKHYASEYYDPVKAHEYYERTKKLKGRRSTSSLNEKGRSAAEYVKNEIDKKRTKRVRELEQQADEDLESYRDKMRKTLESHVEEAMDKIETMRASLENLSPESRAKKMSFINSQIKGLRDKNNLLRDAEIEEFKRHKETILDKLNSDKTAINSEYDEKYLTELDGLKKQSEFKKVQKAGRSRGRSQKQKGNKYNIPGRG